MLEFIAFVVVAYFVIMWGVVYFVLVMQCFANWVEKSIKDERSKTETEELNSNVAVTRDVTKKER